MDTRERILVEAFRLLLMNGYRNVSLNDVVEAVGVTKGGFYHYFKSKDELYIEVMNAHVLSLFDGMAVEMARPAESAREALHRLVVFVLQSYDDLVRLVGAEQFKGLITLIFSGLDRFDFIIQRITDAYRELMTTVARTVELGKAAGQIRPEADAEAAAFQLMAMGEGSLVLWAIGLGTADRQNLIEAEFDIFWRGVAAIDTDGTRRHAWADP